MERHKKLAILKSQLASEKGNGIVGKPNGAAPHNLDSVSYIQLFSTFTFNLIHSVAQGS